MDEKEGPGADNVQIVLVSGVVRTYARTRQVRNLVKIDQLGQDHHRVKGYKVFKGGRRMQQRLCQ